MKEQSTKSIYFEAITPIIAKEWLKSNTSNPRKLSMRDVATLSRAMKDGSFCETHQGIAFYDDGTLADGQHRLQAIVDSGVTVELPVARGIKKSARGAIDIHRSRDAGTRISRSKKAGETVMFISRLNKGQRPTSGEVQEIDRIFGDTAEMLVEYCPTSRAGVSASGCRSAFVIKMVASNNHRDELAKFFWMLVNYDPCNPERILETPPSLRALYKRLSGPFRTSQLTAFAYAWQALSDYTLKRVHCADNSKSFDSANEVIENIKLLRKT